MSRRRIVRRLAAAIDVIEAAESIARDSPQAALRFARAVRETEEALREMPGIGSQRDFDHPALAGMRFHLVRGFRKYLIFYIPRDNGIEIVRVLHGARDLEALFSD